MADIFMSYSRHDRERAEQLAKALSAHGWTVWWDRKIIAGASFDTMIEKELDAAKCVVVLWSQAAVDSEWVKNEAAAAMEHETLVPVLIENVRLPIEFRRRQTIDLSGWDGNANDPALTSLIDGIAAKWGSPATPASHANLSPSPTVVRKRRSWLLWVAAAVGAMVIGAVVLEEPWDPPASAEEASADAGAEAPPQPAEGASQPPEDTSQAPEETSQVSESAPDAQPVSDEAQPASATE